MAVCRARAGSEDRPLWQSLADQFEVKDVGLLPTPMMVILEGGEHSDCGLAIQENMIVPINFDSFSDALRAGSEIFHSLQDLLSNDGQVIAVFVMTVAAAEAAIGLAIGVQLFRQFGTVRVDETTLLKG